VIGIDDLGMTGEFMVVAIDGTTATRQATELPEIESARMAKSTRTMKRNCPL
jgi:hypothetical protein